MATKKMENQEFEKILNEAKEAGLIAFQNCVPVRMQVGGDIFDVCGGAYVIVKDVRKAFSKFLINEKNCYKDSYCGGVILSLGTLSQSYSRNAAFGEAVVRVLKEHGIECRCHSYID